MTAVALGALVVLSLAFGSTAQRAPRLGQRAPEITGGPWINSAPLSLERLRGRVVFVEFWKRFGIWAWPTAVLVDRKGIIRYQHIGEGASDETDSMIRRLLAEGE